MQARNIIAIRRAACGIGDHSERSTQCGKWSKACSKEEVATDRLQGCEHEVAQHVDSSNGDAYPLLQTLHYRRKNYAVILQRLFNCA